MPKRHDNTIRKPFLRSKTIIVILSNMTRTELIVYMEDFKKASSVNHIYIKEDTEIEETTIADIITTIHPIRSDATFIINLDASQVSI